MNELQIYPDEDFLCDLMRFTMDQEKVYSEKNKYKGDYSHDRSDYES